VAALSVAAVAAYARLHTDDTAPETAADGRLCVRVIDGDTIELDGGERIRYIGIDTPETKHPRKPVQRMGPEATMANRILVEGRRVRLEYDAQRRDRYGRTLAYVHVGTVMVNERLVRAGYARVSTYPPNVKYVERFVAAQSAARAARAGLWGAGANPAADDLLVSGGDSAYADDAPPSALVYVTRTGRKYHRRDCRYLRLSSSPLAMTVARGAGYSPCKVCCPDLAATDASPFGG